MPVRFLLGRAGAGKTHACLEGIRAHLREDAVGGGRLLFLVPEQAALQMERALLAPSDLRVAHRAEVLSFTRLAHRILEHAGPLHARAISESARAMVLRRLIEQHRTRLKYYGRCSRLVGLTKQMGRAFAELLSEMVLPADLTPTPSSAAALAETDEIAADSAHPAKLQDLSLLFEAYLEYLGTQRLDPSQHLHAARRCLPQCSWLEGAELWVDGFATMGGQEKGLLVDLARRCRETTLSLLVDPAQLRAGSPPPADEDRGLFALTAQTLRDWESLFRRAGLEVAAPVILEASPLPRYRHAPRLAALEASIFDAGSAAAAQPSVVDEIRAVVLPDRRLEVEYAVSQLLAWVRDASPPCRFRDIAVIARDLAPYHDLLAAALTARGVPYFIDRRRPIAHHPLIELLRALTAMAAEPYRLEWMRLLLKTGLAELTVEAADELENFLIEHGLTGAAAWRGEDWRHAPRSRREAAEPAEYEAMRLRRVNAARRTLMERLDPWLKAASAAGRGNGMDWSEKLAAALDGWKAFDQLEQWAQDAESSGRIAEAQEHRQVMAEVSAFLEDLGFAFADAELGAAELSELIETGLSDLTMGLAPPTLDQVLVGSIERSRHPELKCVILIGFNDGQFPARHAEEPILSDEDRDRLARRGVELSRSRRERILDERLLAYIALTRPSRRLLISCAAADESGKELRPSPYFSDLAALLPGGEPVAVVDPATARQTWDVQTARDLAGRVAREFRTRPAPAVDDPVVRTRWNTLYAAARANGAFAAAARKPLISLSPPREDRLSDDIARRLLGPPLRTSVTALETFASCPFRFLARHGLRLTQRAESGLEPMDVGAIHHAILEDFVSTAAAEGREVTDLAGDQIGAHLEASWHRVCARLAPALEETAARDAYAIHRAQETVERSWRVQRAAAAAGRARPRRAEAPFGFDAPGSMPAWTWTTPKGREVRLRGYIDRVDLAEWLDETLGVVIDYKSGEKKLDLSRAWHGLSLQLIAYLLVLAEHGETLAGRRVRPLASLYVNLRPGYERVQHPREAKSAEDGVRGEQKARGLIHAALADALEAVPPGARAKYYSLHVKQDGSLGRPDSNDALEDDDFQAVLSHTRRRMGELADGILDGDAGVRPCRLRQYSPCSFCEYSSVCRYEMGISRTRFLDGMRRMEAVSRMRESQGAPPSGAL
ncbi:MAG: exodeoxyribonuclease V subunit gamma [Phycisphaerales bacterium]|nr:exodeoxyribonuclease V subunit gamma [Phycisphaerales bacterium]